MAALFEPAAMTPVQECDDDAASASASDHVIDNVAKCNDDDCTDNSSNDSGCEEAINETFVPPESESWDWPMSRVEKKSRVAQLDNFEAEMERVAMMQESRATAHYSSGWPDRLIYTCWVMGPSFAACTTPRLPGPKALGESLKPLVVSLWPWIGLGWAV